MGATRMRVAELWRYPVKSLQGERLDVAEVGPEGLAGDRQWALFDRGTGLGLTARRVPALLFGSARLRPDGELQVVLPDGSATTEDDVLSDWLGRSVALRRADGSAPSYEVPDDEEQRWEAFEGAAGAFHDSAAARVTLLSTGTTGAWDRRRFRANVVLEGAGEDSLVGSRVRLGGAVLDVGLAVPRCVMVTRPQPGGIDRDTSVLKTIHRERGGTLAVGALVARPGTVRVGDEPVTGG
ncbi:MOSC domain-containing protein [Geodermatophilus marinus]|uniref:MOSC domain-containing protein n=1 Tax=Geodermatophilus sp. LHW52908 TaxID=2303986 RepID=UPI001F242E3C|nr:MOSC N-terminal beta barrel domain-containing protein [Geodermatophilus sp. LHW52908]